MNSKEFSKLKWGDKVWIVEEERSGSTSFNVQMLNIFNYKISRCKIKVCLGGDWALVNLPNKNNFPVGGKEVHRDNIFASKEDAISEAKMRANEQKKHLNKIVADRMRSYSEEIDSISIKIKK